jgi:transposase-like protein
LKERALEAIMYGLNLCLLRPSFGGISHALDPFVKKSHEVVWKRIQRYEPSSDMRREKVLAFFVDETYVKTGSFEALVCVVVEPVHRFIFGVYLFRHQNMVVAQLFLSGLVEKHG